MPKYRAHVDRHFRFAEDLLVIRLAKRTSTGLVPITLTLTEHDSLMLPIADDVLASELPTELCEAIFNALAPTMVGTASGNHVQEIAQLRAQLARTTKQLEDLIAGIGRLGNGS